MDPTKPRRPDREAAATYAATLRHAGHWVIITWSSPREPLRVGPECFVRLRYGTRHRFGSRRDETYWDETAIATVEFYPDGDHYCTAHI